MLATHFPSVIVVFTSGKTGQRTCMCVRICVRAHAHCATYVHAVECGAHTCVTWPRVPVTQLSVALSPAGCAGCWHTARGQSLRLCRRNSTPLSLARPCPPPGRMGLQMHEAGEETARWQETVGGGVMLQADERMSLFRRLSSGPCGLDHQPSQSWDLIQSRGGLCLPRTGSYR